MKIRQIRGHTLLTEESRRRLESLVFSNAERARIDLQCCFPNHLVLEKNDTFCVSTRDKSIIVAEFRRVEE